VLADDQVLLRGTLRLLLENSAGMEVVGEAGDGEEAVQVVRRTNPDVVLMDIRMPVLDGVAATKTIRDDPALAGTKVLILTTFEIDEYVADAIRAGASGFIGKGAEPSELLAALRTVASGGAVLSPTATQMLMSRVRHGTGGQDVDPARLDVLTPRERDVLELVGSGLTNDEISRRLFVSPHTVKTHLNRSMSKLNISERAQLVVLAWETGLVRSSADPDRPDRDHRR
jgi:DNA-binding NarL/FixJ family response regulator